jgi:hypothetical protein
MKDGASKVILDTKTFPDDKCLTLSGPFSGLLRNYKCGVGSSRFLSEASHKKPLFSCLCSDGRAGVLHPKGTTLCPLG